MPNDKGLFQSLADFSFQERMVRRIIKVLYPIALLAGVISVVALVVNSLEQSPAQGLLALVFSVVGLFVGVLCVRMVLEILLAILRIAENIEHMAGGGNP